MSNLFPRDLIIKCCNGCTAEMGRAIGCHATCKRYKEEKERAAELAKEMQKAKDIEVGLDLHKRRTIIKVQEGRK